VQHSSKNSPEVRRERGRLVVIAGPSGAGKSTIVRRLLDQRPFRFSVSATTRDPRPGELDGVHYRFLDVTQFRRMIGDSQFLEWADYGANLYGTPLAPVLDTLDRGEDVLLEIEVQGARQVREAYPDALMIFIRAPSLDELARRLRRRGDTNEDQIERRLEIAHWELSIAENLFDHIVVNADIEEATEEVLRLVSA
jgi:guanylate kinase